MDREAAEIDKKIRKSLSGQIQQAKLDRINQEVKSE